MINDSLMAKGNNIFNIIESHEHTCSFDSIVIIIIIVDGRIRKMVILISVFLYFIAATENC